MTTPSDAWPNRKLAATVVDTDPPPPVAWPRRKPAEPSPDAWATTKKPQRTPRRLGHRPQLAAAAPAQGRSAGRWIVSATLWGLAGGLLAGQSLVAHVDRGMEVGMAWLAPRAPSFLRHLRVARFDNIEVDLHSRQVKSIVIDRSPLYHFGGH